MLNSVFTGYQRTYGTTVLCCKLSVCNNFFIRDAHLHAALLFFLTDPTPTNENSGSSYDSGGSFFGAHVPEHGYPKHVDCEKLCFVLCCVVPINMYGSDLLLS